LRAAGFNVLSISENASGSSDAVVVEIAAREARVLVTEDKDFGWLVFVSSAENAGVLLVRFPGNARGAMVEELIAAVREHERELVGRFSVLQPGQLRTNPRP
jgi:predicted nuclease of predicted toxin-antitoxin system